MAAEITEIPEQTPAQGDEPTPQMVEIEVGDPRVWEELSLGVTGLSAGQEGRFSHRDPGGSEGRLSPERHFTVKVVAVKERDLPPLDDELAHTVGDFEDLAELTDHVRKQLEMQKTHERHQARREALLRELRARHSLELPRGVVDQEVEHLVNDYARTLARQGVDLENGDIDWREVAEQTRPKAEEHVHTRLLLDAVADREGITVDAGELDEALSVLARAQNTSVPALRRTLQEADRLDGFRREARRNKTVRHLMGEEPATIEPGASETSEDPSAAAEGGVAP